MLRPLPLVLAVLAAVAPAAWATTADDICAPGADPCIVLQGTTVNVTNGSVLDFGNRALVLSSGSGTKLDAGTGSMAILAGSVTLNPGSALLARGGVITVTTTGDVSVLRSGTSKARIDVSSALSPGAITLDSGGSIEVQGIVTAQATAAETGSGTVSLTSMGDIVVSGDVIISGGGQDIGGDLTVSVPLGSLLVSGVLDVTGGDGGSIDVVVGDALTTVGGGSARLDAKSNGSEGDGGDIDLVSTGGDVTLGSPMYTQGSTGVDFGGSGGDISIEATAGKVSLAAVIDQSGATPDGDGGDLDVSAGVDVVQTGTVTTVGRNQFGLGGGVDLFAERSVTVGTIDASGLCDTCAGGDVTAAAWCSVTVPSGVVVKANGGGGFVYVQSGGDMDVHGNVQAGNPIQLFYREAANPPDTTGAIFKPSMILKLTPTLIPCGGPPGVKCGDGVIDADVGETCDDGNRTNCDGCSSICLVEQCGDGHLGCDQFHHQEACDDGNTTSCDGCAADCSRRDRVCGDGIMECGEQCDTGSAVDCDAGACSAQCKIEACQNGRVECGEQCDDGGPTPSCDDMCMFIAPPSCGNGIQEAGEACDDGNLTDCDGCSHLCQEEGCGNGVTECGETCDDFNTESCDGCSAVCQTEECGNGTVDCGEVCDEGDQNGQPGSACLTTCEEGSLCTEESTEPCIPCGSALECDPLGICGGRDCVDGVCMSASANCTSDDPCEVASCNATQGCVYDPVLGFDSVRCRLADLDMLSQGETVDIVGRASIGKLLSKALAKVDQAEAAIGLDSRGKAKRALKSGRKKVKKLGKKIGKLQPKHITDPATGAMLSEKAADALQRWEALQAAQSF